MYRGELVSLRPFTREHMERTLGWVNDSEVAFPLGRCRPVTMLEHEQWYQSAVRDSRNVFFAIEETRDGTHVGNIWLWGIHGENRNAELRILVGQRDQQRRGFGSEAVKLLLDMAFTRLNLHKVFLYVLAGNEPALKAFTRAGMRIEGTLREEFFVGGRYEDVHRLGILRTEWEAR